MLAKASWRIVQKDEGLWCKVFEKKYLKRHSMLDDNYDKHTGCSSTWNSVLYGAKLLRPGMGWRVGNGKLIKFWIDDWTGLGPLSNFALHPDAIVNHALVHEFWLDNDWNLQLLLAYLPSHIVDEISKTPISQFGDVSKFRDLLLMGGSLFAVPTNLLPLLKTTLLWSGKVYGPLIFLLSSRFLLGLWLMAGF